MNNVDKSSLVGVQSLNAATIFLNRMKEKEETNKRKEETTKRKEKLDNLTRPASVNPLSEHPHSLSPPVLSLSMEERMEVDNRSIYIGNVDYGTENLELEQHFVGCGPIKRITIFSNKFTGQSKGYSYIEFVEKESALLAVMAKNGSLFRGRILNVQCKRKNRPGMCATNRPPRGRGGYRGARGFPQRTGPTRFTWKAERSSRSPY